MANLKKSCEADVTCARPLLASVNMAEKFPEGEWRFAAQCDSRPQLGEADGGPEERLCPAGTWASFCGPHLLDPACGGDAEQVPEGSAAVLGNR